jgi:hypothetical protein
MNEELICMHASTKSKVKEFLVVIDQNTHAADGSTLGVEKEH